MFRCEFCGSRVRFAGLESHRKTAHPEAFEAVERADAETRKKCLKIIGPGLIAWIGIFLYALFIGEWWQASWWAPVLIAMLLAPVGLLVPCIFIARRVWRPAYAAIELVRMSCYICDANVLRRDFLDHLALLHPIAARRARIMRFFTGLLLCLFFGAFAVVGLAAVGTPSSETYGTLLIAVITALFVALGGLVVYIGYFSWRGEKLDRESWRGPHG